MQNIKDKTILVTGGAGFFGRSVVKNLVSKGSNTVVFRSRRYDLRDLYQCRKMFEEHQFDLVVNCAANTGGILYNAHNSANLFSDNIRIATNVLECCHRYGKEKCLNVTTSCSYPSGVEVLTEDLYWEGRPHGSVEFFGIAKRAGEAYGRALHKQHGANIVSTCITNLYGPHDNFSENGKVVSNLIRKFLRGAEGPIKQGNLYGEGKEEKNNIVTCLGSGAAKRDLLFVDDAAEAVVRALQVYEDPTMPINIGSGAEISIKDLAETIARIVGFDGETRWDTNYGDGQLRKLLDITRMREILNYEPTTSLEDGLMKTIQWYRESLEI